MLTWTCVAPWYRALISHLHTSPYFLHPKGVNMSNILALAASYAAAWWADAGQPRHRLRISDHLFITFHAHSTLYYGCCFGQPCLSCMKLIDCARHLLCLIAHDFDLEHAYFHNGHELRNMHFLKLQVLFVLHCLRLSASTSHFIWQNPFGTFSLKK